jgi:hypothetical protein
MGFYPERMNDNGISIANMRGGEGAALLGFMNYQALTPRRKIMVVEEPSRLKRKWRWPSSTRVNMV